MSAIPVAQHRPGVGLPHPEGGPRGAECGRPSRVYCGAAGPGAGAGAIME
jgi:hypothetical protein